MRTFNLNGIELLSTRELATVKGGEGIPTPIIIIEEGIGAPAVETFSALVLVAPAAPAKKKK
jgi:hypothetical protein